MKFILTLLFVLSFVTASLANTENGHQHPSLNIESHNQIEFSKMGTVLDSGIVIDANHIENEAANKNSIARLYKFKNSRIKKALAFTTKRDKAKMA
ncbi:hypothetical protein MNBD_BACTEROID03-2614 [hydrothermal vent metagenome]|uniref:Uncharacterized protein n=1 Tax=hydrothermal vent metagenome TaxID=652676 RepID=A0A3B0T677_9ZZZZ